MPQPVVSGWASIARLTPRPDSEKSVVALASGTVTGAGSAVASNPTALVPWSQVRSLKFGSPPFQLSASESFAGTNTRAVVAVVTSGVVGTQAAAPGEIPPPACRGSVPSVVKYTVPPGAPITSWKPGATSPPC